MFSLYFRSRAGREWLISAKIETFVLWLSFRTKIPRSILGFIILPKADKCPGVVYLKHITMRIKTLNRYLHKESFS